AAPGNRQRGRRRHPPVRRRDRLVHHTGLSLPRGRCDDDQFPLAALDPVHAGGGVLRARGDEARLCPRDRRGLPVLFLRRRLPAVPALGLTKRKPLDSAERYPLVPKEALSWGHGDDCAGKAFGSKAKALMAEQSKLRAISRRDAERTPKERSSPAPMSDAFSFRLLATDGAARRGDISTPHGSVATPAFLPIGTQATVKGLTPEAVRASGADIVLANTYHLMLRPGAERIAALGGLHRFMNWPRAILTDSGGFQVMSLSQLRKVEDKCVTFRSHLDGAIVELSPERAIEIQHLLGSDIAMQLDECLQLPASQAELRRAMQLSLAWAERSKRAFERTGGPALFAIVQGGDDLELRAESARVVTDMGFHGYAIGGLAVGEPQQVMLRIV